MIVVVASRVDGGAAELVARWSAHGARLLTPADLSRRGWRHHVGADPADADARAVIDGEIVPTAAIRGVVTRLPAVLPAELTRIAAADRDYVAAEMNAFLIAWLSSLRCPMINRPTAASLIGPAWRPEVWVRVAAGLGLPVRRAGAPPARTRRVVVIGDRCVGACTRAVAAGAMRLAGAARVALLDLELEVDGDALVSASVWPRLDRDELADAALAQLAGAA